MATHETELALRALALDTKSTRDDRRSAIAVLADFYEERGQPSRAALWRAQLERRPLSSRTRMLQEVPDLQTRPHHRQGFDCRRNQMMWLLRQQGLSLRKIGAAFGLSVERVRQISALEEGRILMHARNEQNKPTMNATKRLTAAGALHSVSYNKMSADVRRGFSLGDAPPEDWPAEHKLRKQSRT